MNDKTALSIIVAMVLIPKHMTASVYYHEPSRTEFKPEDTNTDFGFTLGHQDDQLVVGAPHAESMGRVYSCTIKQDLRDNKCTHLNINVMESASDYDKNYKEHKYCLGATIATSPKYILTCAPLWSANQTIFYGSFGACFIYLKDSKKERRVRRLEGIFEQFSQKEPLLKDEVSGLLYGGLGWSSLADEKNEVMLVGKPFSTGDIQYVVNSNNLELDQNLKTKSLFLNKSSTDRDRNNKGYALAAGRFSNDTSYNDTTIYAVSMKDKLDKGIIFFVSYDKEKQELKPMEVEVKRKNLETYMGDMYGTVLSSADMNNDGIADLLVGAPLESALGGFEAGTLYIHLGGKLVDMTAVKKKIVSRRTRARFGTAIATSDLDGDSIPEIIVSAPYEESGSGSGVLYILSGHEVMEETGVSQIVILENLKYTQRIENNGLQSFGFSLQVIPDINKNGCDDLAVGAPLSASVTVLRCVPTVTASVSISRIPEEIKTTDSNFTAKICVQVLYKTKRENVVTQLKVINTVQGKGMQLPTKDFVVNLVKKPSETCETVTVNLATAQNYTFTSKLEYLNDESFKGNEFNPEWIRMDKYSQLETNKPIPVQCPEDNCKADLGMEILLDGSEKPSKFYVAEKTSKTVRLMISNNGSISYRACVTIKVTGAIEEIKCHSIEKHDDYVQCLFQKQIARNDALHLDFPVVINRVKNINDALIIEANLYDECGVSNPISKKLKVEYIVQPINVYILDGSHNVPVTETQIKTNATLIDKHEYKIVNNGSLEWENVIARVHVPRKAYIKNYFVIGHDKANCVEEISTSSSNEFICTGLKLYADPLVISVKTEILYSHIKENLVNKNLKVESSIDIIMPNQNDSSINLKKSQTTTINYIKEKTTTIGNNIAAIIAIVVIAAILILVIIAAILYKIGFFKRKEKSRLDSIKASVNSRSRSEGVKPSTSEAGDLPQNSRINSTNSMEDFDIEVMDDCPFDTVPLSTDDNTALIAEDNTLAPKTKKSYRSTSSRKESSSTGPREKKHNPSTSNSVAGGSHE